MALPAANPEAPTTAARPLRTFVGLREINPPADPLPEALHAIVGGKLIDGRGAPPVADSVILIQGHTILAAGPRSAITIPSGATIRDATGMSVLPGLVDCHFHLGPHRTAALPQLWLANGVTTLRDPGVHIEDYHFAKTNTVLPRLFLTGPHFDQTPPAYPKNSVLLSTEEEVHAAVERYVRQGASAIKVYFRLPLPLIAAACDAAHAQGLPVTAHLELVDAEAAIHAGLDGVEHITSFGTALAPPELAARFRDGVAADNSYRDNGRFRLWSELNVDNAPRLSGLIETIVARGVVVAPTLGLFERLPGDRNTEDYHVAAYSQMKRFVELLHRAGARIVTSSHLSHPHAEFGWAFHHEMELLVQCGMTPLEVITASTLRGAEFLGCADRLGSIEAGKLADLILVEGDPSQDIRAMLNVAAVMHHGSWVQRE